MTTPVGERPMPPEMQIDTAQPAAAEHTDAAPSRDALLAELEALPSDEQPTEAPADTAAEPAAEPDEEQAVESAPAEGDEDDAEPEQAEAEQTDPEVAKRLEAIQRAEKRAKDAVAREREQLAEEKRRFEDTWRPRIEAAEKFEQLKPRAKYDPAGVLLSLGLSPEDFDAAARQIYALSTTGQRDPKLRDAATRELRERQSIDELSRTQRELQELKQQIEQERQAQDTQRHVQRFLDATAKAVGDDTPLVRTMIAKTGDKARARLAEIAEEMVAATDEVPDPADVVRELERRRRAELEELGIDVSAAIKAAPSKKKSPVAGETKTAKTLSHDLGTTTSPRSATLSRREELDDVRRALEEGRLE